VDSAKRKDKAVNCTGDCIELSEIQWREPSSQRIRLSWSPQRAKKKKASARQHGRTITV